MRQAIYLAIERGVLLGRIEHRRNEQFGLDLAQVDGLVNAEFLLGSDDAVLRRLRQIEARAAGGAELGDHFFVVRQRELDVDACFLLELCDHIGRNIVGPGDDLELVLLGSRGRGKAEGSESGNEHGAQHA